MTELHRALADIDAIRGQVARAAEFRGYGPATLATTGLLAMLAASAQSAWLPLPMQQPDAYLGVWVVTAAVSLALIGVEAVFRTRRAHSDLVVPMLQSAAEQFLPAIVAGLMLTVVLARAAPRELWMLPGLWQLIFSLGVFGSCRFLPRPMFAVGIWYLASGLIVLALGPGADAPEAWRMGIPFGVGQLLAAAVLYAGYRDHAARE